MQLTILLLVVTATDTRNKSACLLLRDMEKTFLSFIKDVGGGEGERCHYTKRLDTYGCGCAHDCGYCYAKSLLDFRGLWNPQAPAVVSMQKVRNAIRKLNAGDVVRLGGMTDCFQPIEKKRRVTYQTIQKLNKARVEYLIVTKSALVASDEYIKIMDKSLAHIQITVTTTDDEKSLTYEKASVPSERIKAIEKLQAHGFDVQLRLSPYIPDFVDMSIINAVKCDKILVEFLRVNAFIKKHFDIDYDEYTVKDGGYYHLPLEKKIEYMKALDGWEQITVCEDETRAYEYWREHVNFNKDDCCNLRRGQDERY